MEASSLTSRSRGSWRETVLRLTRERIQLHRHPDAVARALREVPRSVPRRHGSSAISMSRRWWSPATTRPTRAIHTLWPRPGRRRSRARLISEEPGKAPLAWQGGRLAGDRRLQRAAGGGGAAQRSLSRITI